MKSATELSKAINDVFSTIKKEKENETIDIELFCNNCIKEFMIMDLPFYSIKLKDNSKINIVIETPFTTSCNLNIEQYVFGSRDVAAVLYVNGKKVRKVKLEEKNPEYMKRISHAILDYFKRYIILTNKFN